MGSKTFIGFLNGLIEEGIACVSTYANRIASEKHVKCGIITAITGEELGDHRHRWHRVGFLSRVVPFSYSYGIDSVKKVFQYILGLDYMEPGDHPERQNFHIEGYSSAKAEGRMHGSSQYTYHLAFQEKTTPNVRPLLSLCGIVAPRLPFP